MALKRQSKLSNSSPRMPPRFTRKCGLGFEYRRQSRREALGAGAGRADKAKLELLDTRDSPLDGDGRDKPRVLREVLCPGCETQVALRGEVVRSGAPRVDQDGQLVQTDIALPSRLECPVCELKLHGIAQVTDAGLGDPVLLRDYPDPVETFGVDLGDYHDDFVQSLGREYEDESRIESRRRGRLGIPPPEDPSVLSGLSLEDYADVAAIRSLVALRDGRPP